MITWNKDLMVNIKIIDEQHEKLVNFINQLYLSIKNMETRATVSRVLKELSDYTVYHFSTEEKLMTSNNYPELSMHFQAHNDLVHKVNDFQNMYNNNESDISMDLFNFLKDWLVKHIMGTDKKLSQFLRSKGVS